MSDEIMRDLRAWGLTLPGAHGKSPWPGHDDLAVKDKTFAYLSADGEPFSLSCKLPYTHEVALDLPFAKPTGYGLGKSGWVTFLPPKAEIPAFEQMKEWLEESYRAQAPRKLVKELDSR
jgi:predicted DNA-binding protein (MmcQ/YjbR family)